VHWVADGYGIAIDPFDPLGEVVIGVVMGASIRLWRGRARRRGRLGFVVDDELEAVGEQRLDHLPALSAGELRRRSISGGSDLGVDVVMIAIGFDPCRAPTIVSSLML